MITKNVINFHQIFEERYTMQLCWYKTKLRFPSFSFRPFLCFTIAEKQELYLYATNINLYIYTWLQRDYLCETSLKKQMWRLTKAKTEMKREHWTKIWNWSSCTKLALRASWTHGLIAQSVRASERNSVVVGSNPTEANFL